MDGANGGGEVASHPVTFCSFGNLDFIGQDFQRVICGPTWFISTLGISLISQIFSPLPSKENRLLCEHTRFAICLVLAALGSSLLHAVFSVVSVGGLLAGVASLVAAPRL